MFALRAALILHNILATVDGFGFALLYVVRDPKYESRPLEIPDLRSYTFADFDNGTYGFWVAGKAGWFELKEPAVTYRAIFDGMNEAAGMFYFMAKKYRNAIAAKWSLNSRTKPYHLTIFKGVRTNQILLAVLSLAEFLKIVSCQPKKLPSALEYRRRSRRFPLPSRISGCIDAGGSGGVGLVAKSDATVLQEAIPCEYGDDIGEGQYPDQDRTFMSL